ncbi:MAG: SIR2 family NAD-dependent protein deacylase [Bacteroidota bacterium]
MMIQEDLIQQLRNARRVVVLTGAGVSQESGLRTFRDTQTGLWAQYKPNELASPEAFRRDPKLVWDWYAWRREAVKAVRPNPGHYALVEMERRVPQFTLITQNVDGLHLMAGSQHVLQLHGNIQRVRCADCYTFTEVWDDDSESVPRWGLRLITAALWLWKLTWNRRISPQRQIIFCRANPGRSCRSWWMRSGDNIQVTSST